MNNESARGAGQNTGFSLDYKRLLYRAIRYWYLVVLSFVLGIVAAYLINRYTTRIYPVNTSIIIRESEERADAKLLYNNPLANPYRNFINEPFILRSFPLIQSVIEDLNFEIQIRKEGNFKTTEQYNTLPVIIRAAEQDQTISGTFVFEVLDDKSYRCLTEGENPTENNRFLFGDTISCKGNNLVVFKKGDVSRIVGEKYQVRILNPTGVVLSYINRIKISWALSGASVVNLDINGAIPQKEIDFLNQLVNNYQAYDLNKKNQAASRSIEFIDEQLRLIGDSLAMFEHQLQRFKQQNIVTDLDGETLRLYGEMEALEAQKVNLMVSGSYYDYLEKYLKESSSGDQVILPSSMGISDEILNTMVSTFIDVQTETKALKQGDKNPLIVERLRVKDQAKANIIQSMQNLRNTDKIKRSFLDQQISKIEKSIGRLPQAERMLVNIRRNYSLSESIYIFLMQKRAEAGISQASTTSDIITVNPPRAGGAITPMVMQNYMAYGGAGLVIPVLIFLLLEVVNTKVQSKEDIEKITTIPFIGGIGHKESDSNLIVIQKPKSAIAESFRALRSNLNYFTEGKEKKIFLITSSLSGEGKTFTTVNLATVFALSGKKTIIVGADLRKPKIFEDFGLNNTQGLSTYLSGMTNIDNIIQHTSIENLSLISGGPVPPNPSELLLSKRMDDLLDFLKQDFDFILLDTPPMTLITDGLVLSKFADHTIYLSRQNYTPRAVLQMADELYQKGKLRNISIVLNDITKTGPGYGYGYYGYGYYSYGYGYGYGYPYLKGKKGGKSDYYVE